MGGERARRPAKHGLAPIISITAPWAALQRRLVRLLDPVGDKLHLYPLCARDRPDDVYLGIHPIDDSAAVIL